MLDDVDVVDGVILCTLAIQLLITEDERYTLIGVGRFVRIIDYSLFKKSADGVKLAHPRLFLCFIKHLQVSIIGT